MKPLECAARHLEQGLRKRLADALRRGGPVVLTHEQASELIGYIVASANLPPSPSTAK